jgi:hypothetical protein
METRIERAYAVFDKARGNIVHLHHSIIVSPGANTPHKDDDEAATALRHATKLSGRRLEELAVIPINSGDIRLGYQYTIDVATKELRETALQRNA